MTLQRHPGWENRFSSLVQSRLSTPFEWGSHDCCLFAADCVHAICKVDPAKDLRGTYSTALEAARVLDERGGLDAIVYAVLGDSIAPLLARVGDVGLVVTERPSLAVCNGSHWLAPSMDGLATVPLEMAVKAWRV